MYSLIIHTDGGARGNPGPAAIGITVKTESGEIVTSLCRKIGQTTNNVAEYSAVIAALEWVKERNQLINKSTNQQIIKFYLDSSLVVNQLNGLFKVKDANLRDLLLKVRILEQEIGLPVLYAYIPREKNREADALVNNALDVQ